MKIKEIVFGTFVVITVADTANLRFEVFFFVSNEFYCSCITRAPEIHRLAFNQHFLRFIQFYPFNTF